jgi:Alkylmercury lyase
MMTIDARLRREIYDISVARGTPPSIAQLSLTTATSSDNVRTGLARLAAGRILVVQPESGEILMAPPFSAVPTPFLVETSRHASYANCAWDAFGVPVTLGEPALVRTAVVKPCSCRWLTTIHQPATA